MEYNNQQPATAPKKKRAYAAQAYEFGANTVGLPSPNTPLGPTSPGYAADPLANQFGQMNLGLSGAQQPGQIPAAQFHTPAPAPVGVDNPNKLISSDLIQQPFNVQELDLPPPPIILPPNASVTSSPYANCPPAYIRCTLNSVPTNHSLLKKSRLPLALVIQPYITLHDAEDPVPIAPDQVISRCRRCRSYINPFVTFLDQGHRWRCNMCNLINDVPQSFDWDAAEQRACDRWQRPELNYSVVEFVAPQEYMVRAPQPLVYLFIFDVSISAITNGLLATAARCILESLDRIPNADRRTRLGFLAVDASLHYFLIPRDDSESDVELMVVGDLDEPFLPTPSDLVVSLIDCRQKIEKFLGKLHAMFRDNQNSSSALGSALRAAHNMISNTGGKIVVLSASLPNVGYAHLNPREDKSLLGTSKEGSLLQSANSFYKSFAVECSKVQVSIDMFLFSGQYQDVATLSNLPRYTGGQTYFYPGWNAARSEDVIKFAREFSEYLSAEIGLEAVLRVRATTGLRMSLFYGNFFNRSSDLCAFPAFPRDQAYVVEISIDETVTRPNVCLQTAALNTTCNGERRIRVLTVCLPTTESLASVYAGADQLAILTYFSHKASERALGSGLDNAREAAQAKIIEILQAYKKELAGGNMGGGGVQLPVNLRALPVLFLGLIKHLGLRKSAHIPSDLRSAALCLLSTLPLPLLIQYIYPRLYSLHDMPDEAGLPDPNTGEIVLPPALNLTSSRFVPYGLYLIDDCQTQFLWVGTQVVPALVQDVFGLEDKNQIKQGKTTLPVLENEFNERVRAVLEKSKDHRAKGAGSIFSPALYVVREDGEPSLKLWAQTMLIEDHADQGMSLLQWMGLMREKVVQ